MEVKKRRKLNWKSKRDRKKRHNTKTVPTLKMYDIQRC